MRSKRPAHARPGRRAGCAVVTISDTRGRKDDASGDAIARRLASAGHTIVSRAWVRDEVSSIRRAVRVALRRRDVDAVLVTGGTGIAPRDRTPEALSAVVEQPLPGFGELFRMLSYRQVGSAAWLSRAGAGVARGRLMLWLPGSTKAVELAMEKLIVPELDHALRLLNRPMTGA